MKNFLIVFSLVLLGLVTGSMAQPPPQVPIPPWENNPPIPYPFPIECYETNVNGLEMTYCYYINPFTIPPTYTITSYGVNDGLEESDDRWLKLRLVTVDKVSDQQGMDICHQNPGPQRQCD